MSDIHSQLAVAMNELANLKKQREEDKAEFEAKHEENRTEIEKVKARLSTYDLLAAKWGGMCMLAVGVGTFAIEFSDKIKSFLASK